MTRIGYSCSDVAYLSSGVVQGSSIGPLFLIYVTTFHKLFLIAVYVSYYADDIKLYSVMRTVNDNNNLQESLDVLCNWSCAWQLPISPFPIKMLCAITNYCMSHGH